MAPPCRSCPVGTTLRLPPIAPQGCAEYQPVGQVQPPPPHTHTQKKKPNKEKKKKSKPAHQDVAPTLGHQHLLHPLDAPLPLDRAVQVDNAELRRGGGVDGEWVGWVGRER